MSSARTSLLRVVLLGCCLCLSGCAWSHYTDGSIFNDADIHQIVKGKTTTADLMNLFGTPYSKTPLADGGEQWFYYCSNNLDVAGGVPNLMVVNTTKKQQNLIVSVSKDKIVLDYKTQQGPITRTTTEVSAALIIPVVLGTQSSTNLPSQEVKP